jgi:hypothetical protein
MDITASKVLGSTGQKHRGTIAAIIKTHKTKELEKVKYVRSNYR